MSGRCLSRGVNGGVNSQLSTTPYPRHIRHRRTQGKEEQKCKQETKTSLEFEKKQAHRGSLELWPLDITHDIPQLTVLTPSPQRNCPLVNKDANDTQIFVDVGRVHCITSGTRNGLSELSEHFYKFMNFIWTVPIHHRSSGFPA